MIFARSNGAPGNEPPFRFADAFILSTENAEQSQTGTADGFYQRSRRHCPAAESGFSHRGGRMNAQSESRQQITRPDLALQPGPAGQIGADCRAVRQLKVTFLLCGIADISTWLPQSVWREVMHRDGLVT
jgi:hypothetical protein